MAVVILAHNKKLSFKWLRFPVIGIEALDQAHQELLDQLNVFKALLSEGCDPAIAEERLHNLRTWFGHHFADEDRRMLMSGFPDAAAHLAAHQKLITGLLLSTSFDTDGQEGFDLDALITWEAQHINRFDRPMAEYLLKANDSKS
ncbi:MAG: hemerythrin family protein [Magnetococcus sp. YQC-9]